MARPHDDTWIEKARARGLGGTLSVVLDALEPLGPLGAQILWILQPASGIFGWRQTVAGIAEALEEPGGVERLRRQLAETTDHADSDSSR